jgi:hypothetical protein
VDSADALLLGRRESVAADRRLDQRVAADAGLPERERKTRLDERAAAA